MVGAFEPAKVTPKALSTLRLDAVEQRVLYPSNRALLDGHKKEHWIPCQALKEIKLERSLDRNKQWNMVGRL